MLGSVPEDRGDHLQALVQRPGVRPALYPTPSPGCKASLPLPSARTPAFLHGRRLLCHLPLPFSGAAAPLAWGWGQKSSSEGSGWLSPTSDFPRAGTCCRGKTHPGNRRRRAATSGSQCVLVLCPCFLVCFLSALQKRGSCGVGRRDTCHNDASNRELTHGRARCPTRRGLVLRSC